jgi:hypothetical protein
LLFAARELALDFADRLLNIGDFLVAAALQRLEIFLGDFGHAGAFLSLKAAVRQAVTTRPRYHGTEKTPVCDESLRGRY